MDGVVDCGVGFDKKTSPRRVAIERAQAKLRKEYDVREERKRELEFLEKGGNPLDFNFVPATSISLQSTSFTDRSAEQHVISEAKGSFALAASPHGDSIESSGRPRRSVSRETNIADNLLLFDGVNSNPTGEKNVKRTGKRGNVSLHEQCSEGDGCPRAKETDDSLMFHLGVKSQAYARRNRTRSSRDSHGNKSTVHIKPASPTGNNISTAPATDNKLDMEVDGLLTRQTSSEKIKGGVPDGAAEVNNPKIVHNCNQFNQHANSPAEKVDKDEATSVNSHSCSPERTRNFKDISGFERANGSSIPDKFVADGQEDDLSGKNCEVRRLSDANTDTQVVEENRASGNENCGMVRGEEGVANGESQEKLVFPKTSDNRSAKEHSLLIGVAAPITASDELISAPSNLSKSIIRVKDEVELSNNKINTVPQPESLKTNGEIVSKPERNPNSSNGSHSINKVGVIVSSLVVPTCEPSVTALSKRGTLTSSAVQKCEANNFRSAKKAREDAILKESRTIEAKLKRTAHLSTSYKSSEKQRKCHWDFVLEEMAWMANDFMQERLWKTSAAAQICHSISSSGRSKFEQEIIYQKQKIVARTLAKAITEFWHSADAFQTTREASKGLNGESNSDLSKSCKVNGEAEKNQGSKSLEAENFSSYPAIQGYAARFLKHNQSTSSHSILAEAPATPDRVNDAGIVENSLEGDLSEESLFYTVPPGAMQVYRETAESQWLNYQKMVNPMNQEASEASPCDSLPDGPQKNEYEEEGESGSYFFPGPFEGYISSKFTQKKKKNFQQKYAPWSYNVGSEFPYESRLEGKSAHRSVMFTVKRPSSTPNVGPIPTKRVRTASRQRVASPFAAGPAGSLQLTKTDVSSGDTNSLQDDQSSMYGGSQSCKNMEVESTAEFGNQLPYDGNETSSKSKKKKAKHMDQNLLDSGIFIGSEKGSMFDQRLQADSMGQQEQRDKMKKRWDSQQYESNGSIGIYGQHASKNPKLLKQQTEPSQEAIMPTTGSMPSPVASQTSNMPNKNKFIKIIAIRGKKSKAMKMAAGQSGSGNSWSTLEEQALVVFVHDMGPNWELVSDAINNTLQFKRIFRKPQECKEHHKFLMEKSSGDGADGAEDSGSSRLYPSTIPGIPKGGARQLFQRLQGPMEEDTLKSHFEKIISIGQKSHSCRSQKDTQEPKQITPVHNSHYVSLSQTCPNNLGGSVLSPLDLCDANSSSPDVLALGYQGSHTNGAPIPGLQGSPTPGLSTASGNSMIQGPSGSVLGNNLPSPSTPLNALSRDAQRHCMPRAASLPMDDQQKMHYAQMLSGRNIQQPSLPGALAVGVDRGTHLLPCNYGMGMMGGRATPMPRPGFQAMMSPGMPLGSTGSMLAGPNPVSVHPGTVSGQGNSMMRPCDALQMPRPGQSAEDHRPMMMQDIQMQVSQGNVQSMPPFSALSAPFSTTTGVSSLHSYPPQSHHTLANPNHSSTQQQAYAMRLAKERHLQQRMLPQSQQQPFSNPSAMSPVQSTPQSSSTSSQAQHNKQQMPRNPQSGSTMPNQIMKQRQRQQQQAHQQQQKQMLQQQQQQAKLVKGLGRPGGPMLIHQNLSVDPRNQILNSSLPQASNHQKLYSRPPLQSSKQMPQPPLPSSISLASSAQPQHQRPMHQNMQRLMLQQNRKPSSDQVQPNQMIPDSASCAPSGSSKMQEIQSDTSSRSQKTHLPGSPREKLVGTDTLIPLASEEKQFSQHQQQPRQGVQGNLYARPSNSGPGG